MKTSTSVEVLSVNLHILPNFQLQEIEDKILKVLSSSEVC